METTEIKPRIQIRETYFVTLNGGLTIDLDDLTVYYVTRNEAFRIKVRVVSRNGSYYMVRPVHGEGEYQAHESELDIAILREAAE